MELLLVVVIGLLAAGVAIPSFVKSYRGAKLRASVRAVTMTHRYVRSLAVLNQQYMGIIFNQEHNDLAVVALPPNVTGEQRGKFLDGQEAAAAEDQPPPTTEAGATPPTATPDGVQMVLEKKLEDGVTITDFSVAEANKDEKGNYWIQYYPNGSCDKYSLTLQDDRQQRTKITIDPLSGKAKVENSN